MSKLFLVIGCLLMLVAGAVRITPFPILISGKVVQSINLVILANTAFILAILFKK